jgi:hypothetical protein
MCRLLTSAGLGLPCEYFNPHYAIILGTRWGLKDEHPLSEPALASYSGVLRRKRTRSAVFSIKLQYWQFDAFLRNSHGGVLFKNACVEKLFRSDIVAQLASRFERPSRPDSGIIRGGRSPDQVRLPKLDLSSAQLLILNR